MFLFQALEIIEEVADKLGLRYSQKPRSTRPIVYGESESEEEVEESSTIELKKRSWDKNNRKSE